MRSVNKRFADRLSFLRRMYWTMRSVARDRRRMQTAQKRGGAVVVVPLSSTEPQAYNSPQVDTELLEALVELRRLDPIAYAIIVSHDIEGRSLREIAVRLGLSITQIGRRRRATLARLRNRRDRNQQ